MTSLLFLKIQRKHRQILQRDWEMLLL